MKFPDILNKELSHPLNFKYLLYSIAILFVFDLTYHGSFYISFLFIIFLVDMLGSGFKNVHIPDLLQWVLLLLWGFFEITQSFIKSDALYYCFVIIIVPFFIFILFTNSNFKLRDLNFFFNVLFITGIILSIISFSILMGKNFDLRNRITSSWAHYNLVAAYFMILLMFNISFIVNARKGQRKLFHIFSFVLILLGLFLTQTRGIWLSTLIGIFYYVFKKPKIILPLLLITSLLVVIFYGVIMDRLFSVVNFGNDVSSLGRFQAWYASVLLIKDNFLLGFGFDSFRYLRDSVITAYFVILPHSHNTYLTLILDLGFIGFILYMFFFVKAFYYSIKLRKVNNNPELNKFTDGLQLSFVGFVVAFMFEPYFTVLGTINYMIWILISLSYYLFNHFNYKLEIPDTRVFSN